ncbi:MAG: NAD(P)/FAD-dependent oxidoreductase [Gammaproteobacteria bacterium]|nr:NAD(P)/FAD-dependent oxidoreductase [Gammaproteobacteria bacterium]
MTKLKPKKVMIVGAGPAGMAAALQLKRFGIDPILLEHDANGSLLKNAWRIENYLGFYPGISGVDLLQRFRDHLRRNKIKKICADVEALAYNPKTQLFRAKAHNKVYTADYVIVASGTKPKLLSHRLRSVIKHNVYYEAFFLLKKHKKTIVIIGAGDAAFDYAINLSKSNNVIICNRSKHANALPTLIDQAAKIHHITYLTQHKLKGITPVTAKKKPGFLFSNLGKNVYINADYLLVAIGRIPQKDFYSKGLAVLERSLMKSGRLFLVGDVKNKIYRQVGIAIGDGIKVAMTLSHNLGEHEIKNH